MKSFNEEILPSGRKVLHALFRRKFGASGIYYKWTAPWKGDSGLVKLFLKALEIEESNDPEGIWSQELRQAAKKIPSLDDMRLPMKIKMGNLIGPVKIRGFTKDSYLVSIELRSEEQFIFGHNTGTLSVISIGDLMVPINSLSDFLKSRIPMILGIRKPLSRLVNNENPKETGVSFLIQISAEKGKLEYQTFCGVLIANIRAFIRKHSMNCKDIKKGFKELKP